MALFKHLIFLSVLLTSLISAADKKTVCSVTINSSEEINLFKKYLNENDFNFVELTESSEDDDWLSVSCEKKIQCDVLVVSGHFGGKFFGDSDKELSIEDLESASCKKECEGILHRPKEVFLFGCNTLASKEKDFRSPEAYRQVLINDGFSERAAEQIVAFRYSALGSSYGDRMMQVFSGVPRVYGFSSIGPSGKTVEPLLKKYFESVNANEKNYFSYLNAISNMSSVQNNYLSQALKNTSLTITKGTDSEGFKEFPACVLSSEISVQEKYNWINKTLADPKKVLSSIPAIHHYLEEFAGNKNYCSPEEAVFFEALKTNSSAKEQVLSLLEYKNEAIRSIQAKLLNMSWFFQWLDETEYQAFADKLFELDKIIQKPIPRETVDLFASLNLKIEPHVKEIPEERWIEKNFLVLLQTLDLKSEDLLLTVAKKSLAFPAKSPPTNELWFEFNNIIRELPGVRQKIFFDYYKEQLINADPERKKIIYYYMAYLSIPGLDKKIDEIFFDELVSLIPERKYDFDKKLELLSEVLLKIPVKDVRQFQFVLSLLDKNQFRGEPWVLNLADYIVGIRNLNNEQLSQILDHIEKHEKDPSGSKTVEQALLRTFYANDHQNEAIHLRLFNKYILKLKVLGEDYLSYVIQSLATTKNLEIQRYLAKLIADPEIPHPYYLIRTLYEMKSKDDEVQNILLNTVEAKENDALNQSMIMEILCRSEITNKELQAKFETLQSKLMSCSQYRH